MYFCARQLRRYFIKVAALVKISSIVHHTARYHEHVTGDGVGQVRHGGVGPTTGIIWILTSGAAAWFVPRSPAKMNTQHKCIFRSKGQDVLCAKRNEGKLCSL